MLASGLCVRSSRIVPVMLSPIPDITPQIVSLQCGRCGVVTSVTLKSISSPFLSKTSTVETCPRPAEMDGDPGSEKRKLSPVKVEVSRRIRVPSRRAFSISSVVSFSDWKESTDRPVSMFVEVTRRFSMIIVRPSGKLSILTVPTSWSCTANPQSA